jgi:hypothetical protein
MDVGYVYVSVRHGVDRPAAADLTHERVLGLDPALK